MTAEELSYWGSHLLIQKVDTGADRCSELISFPAVQPCKWGLLGTIISSLSAALSLAHLLLVFNQLVTSQANYVN